MPKMQSRSVRSDEDFEVADAVRLIARDDEVILLTVEDWEAIAGALNLAAVAGVLDPEDRAAIRNAKPTRLSFI